MWRNPHTCKITTDITGYLVKFKFHFSHTLVTDFNQVFFRYVCIRGVFILTTECASLTVTLVVTLRKFFSLIFSILYFQNPFTTWHWVGTAVVFLGTLLYTEVWSSVQAALRGPDVKQKKAEWRRTRTRRRDWWSIRKTATVLDLDIFVGRTSCSNFIQLFCFHTWSHIIGCSKTLSHKHSLKHKAAHTFIFSLLSINPRKG